MEHFIFDVGQENDASAKLRGFLDIVNQNIFIYDDINASVLFTIGGGIGGSGTLNRLAKFTPDGSNVGDSQLFDNAVSIGINTITPSASALLDITSTTQGFLSPRMTQTQRNAIVSPATGLWIYNTTSSHFNFWDGSAWLVVQSSSITSDTLSQVLAAGNTTNGLPIIMTSGDTINFSVGFGGVLNSSATTGSIRSWLLPDANGTIALLNGGQTFTSATWNGTAVGILYGGSGQTTANAALNAFLPSQATFAGKFLQTDGTNTSWVEGNSGTDYSHSFLLMGG